MKIYKKGDSRLINAWAFYDWANSVYPLVISTAIFPIYYSTLTNSFAEKNGEILFLGIQWNPTVLYDYTLSISFLIVALISPLLSGIADYTGNKLKFLKIFCFIGSFSVMGFFFFSDESTLGLGLFLSFMASIGFWGSLVFYNAYLPEISFPKQHDMVSAKGFIFGYSGSLILLILCLFLIQNPNLFGISDPTLPSRISFLLVGIWWISFAQVTFKALPKNSDNNNYKINYIFKGFTELKNVFKSLPKYPQLKFFLISFFFLSVGVQTIILMAGIFGKNELGLPTDKLIMTIILVQIVAILGSYLFSRLSKKIGNILSLKITLFIWGTVCFIAFVLDKNLPGVETYFYIMGVILGFVLGATQTLTRSTYSKLLPLTQNNATYFSFYDVTEKVAIVLGMFVFGLLISITGSMQYSVLALALFFLFSFLLFFKLKNIIG